jgi:hypothetical protein
MQRRAELTEEDGDIFHSCHHRLEAPELHLLDHVLLVPAAPVLNQPLQDVILSLEDALIQDGDGVAVVDQGRQLAQVILGDLVGDGRERQLTSSRSLIFTRAMSSFSQ